MDLVNISTADSVRLPLYSNLPQNQWPLLLTLCIVCFFCEPMNTHRRGARFCRVLEHKRKGESQRVLCGGLVVHFLNWNRNAMQSSRYPLSDLLPDPAHVEIWFRLIPTYAEVRQLRLVCSSILVILFRFYFDSDSWVLDLYVFCAILYVIPRLNSKVSRSWDEYIMAADYLWPAEYRNLRHEKPVDRNSYPAMNWYASHAFSSDELFLTLGLTLSIGH